MLCHVADLFLLGRNVYIGGWGADGKYVERRVTGQGSRKGQTVKPLGARGREMRPGLTLG